MNDSRILSAFNEPSAPRFATASAPPPARALLFDVCRADVALRAVLYVEAVLATALMYHAHGLLEWLHSVALLTGAALPATLAWLAALCAIKEPLARLPDAAQIGSALVLGALTALAACAVLAAFAAGGGGSAQTPWLASGCTGALLAAGLIAALVWRVRGRTPAATTARLAELQSRIRPHFLFNTLNSAIALVGEEPKRAERVLEELAELFRHALAEQRGASTLGEELQLARSYLDIEQVRFGQRLRVEWSVDERVNAAQLPPLILQPLVENAIKHGVEPSPQGAVVRISTQRRGAVALIKITNTVPAGQGRAGHGIALENVRQRLRLLHDMQGDFRTALAKGVYQTRIEVPLPAPAKKSKEKTHHEPRPADC